MTQLPRPSAALVSDNGGDWAPKEGLVAPAIEIFDRDTVRAALDVAAGADPADRRTAIVRILKEARKGGLARIAEAFRAAPRTARPVTRAYAWLTDQIVCSLFDVVSTKIHSRPQTDAPGQIALVAIGGYGRGEMALHSDVDLMFLTERKLTPWAESVVEEMLYVLWDLKLKVGHATRTVGECLRLAREDYTIRTSLVEYRHLTGDEALSSELRRRLMSDLFQSTASDFVEAKLAERAERHRKQGGQRYMVEPNVKEGKGGLRDLQSLFWIGKYVNGVTDAAELVDLGVFTRDEFATFLAAEDFLWAVRCHLHLITGRAMDQLTFDLQVEVADAMGYLDQGGRRAVEHFMQDYFRHATSVGELTRIFLVSLEDAHVKTEPMLTRIFKRRKQARAPYAIAQNRLTVADDAAFLSDKLNMLRIFEEALRTGTLLHPHAMRLIAANLDLIDAEVRATPEAAQIFLRLLLKHGNPERGLRRMNELGALARFIPEFEPIVAMMQFNMYHSYTVDEHIIQCISQLAQIEREELVEELPVASGILKDGVNRRVLYVALLLHDIGKGRQEDHSILGARIARDVAPRLGLKKKEAETVEWLVRHHLLMSDMAQKRDIADPRTVRDFAKAVQTRERLDLLTVLTVCDIRGVGPNTWNNWKAVLIRALYRQTRRGLETGLEDINRTERETEAKRKLREALEGWPAKDIKAELARHYPPYWQGLHVTAHVDFARLLRGLEPGEIRIDLTMDQDRDAARICFAMTDHPGIFARITGALALVGANIVDARTFTTKDGFVTAAFWIQDAAETPYDADRLPRLRKMIERTLNGDFVARDALTGRDKDRLKKRERAFRVPTSITFDNEGSDIYTIIEVDTRDRPGLLHDLSRTLAGANVYISSAVIATYGEQVVDTFYVKDMFGLKYQSEAKQKSLEKKLRDAIAAGTERAAS
ncbi:[protein-PII] uridylyltransferase [Aestuariibius sp. 2305UL40-4]|uniref:[protein-PII] uridylyltransferase n=1 Tax=Aestuariibius violaceus TaxID=3234132 RepID=UPI00345E152D